jgi:formiminoglutamase
MLFRYYREPSVKNWIGRSDSLEHERFFQIVKLLDIRQARPALCQNDLNFALIGFACDAGITRNLGRQGAASGPEEFRKHFGQLALPKNLNLNLYDLGDIYITNSDVEGAQLELSQLVAWAMKQNLKPIIIGGGHELTFGGYVGVSKGVGLGSAQKNNSCGIINFDAHFDLRSQQKGASSGTSFTQIAQWCEDNKQRFNYLVLGLQPAANTYSLYEKANELNVSWVEADYIAAQPAQTQALLEKFLSMHAIIYLSICLDVFSHSVAPGVSAPQSLGLMPFQVMPLIRQIIKSKKALCFDLAEYSPPLDIHNQTGKLCASLVFEIITKSLS